MTSPRGNLGPVITLIVVLAIGAVVQWRINGDLRDEIAELRGEKRADGQPAAAPQQRVVVAGVSAAELARLRADVDQVRARLEIVARSGGAPKAGAAEPMNLIPAKAWKNAGTGTPAAAAETFLWATDGGDWETLAKSIYLDPAAREKAEAMLARLSPAARATYDTPEKLIALLMAREGDNQGMQVLGENHAGDEALVNLRLQKGDGKTKEEGLPFRRTSDGWKLVVNGKAVDKFGKKLAEPPKGGK